MKISVDFSALQKLARKMGNFPSVALPQSKIAFTPLDTELVKGTKIEPTRYGVAGGILPTYEGRHVVLYIKDHSYVRGTMSVFDNAREDASKGNKIHVANCKTLEDMAAQNRFNRYVACNNTTGSFEILGPSGELADVGLHVCKNCLKLLNYKGARDSTSLRNELAANFDYKVFFKTYSSFFKHMPKTMAEEDVGYTKDWGTISQRLREQTRYICSDCGVDLKQHKNLCHVHHINGAKQDNSPSNLAVLCVDCHRKTHHGNMYVSHQDAQTITRLRREQGRFHGGWAEALELVDPAVHGELLILQKRGYSAPEIGYEVVGSDGAVIAELEAAWLDKRECLIIDDKLDKSLLLDWTVWRFGDIAKQA